MEALGLDLRSFIFQLINFLLVLGGLTYLLHKPLIALLDKRQAEIEQSLKTVAIPGNQPIYYFSKQLIVDFHDYTIAL